MHPVNCKLVVVLSVLITVFGCSFIENDMSDSDLREFFQSNKADILRLQELSRVDQVTAISCDWIEVGNRHKINKDEAEFGNFIEKKDFLEICNILRKLDCRKGIGIGHNASSIFSIPVVTFGNVSGGYSKGIIYSKSGFGELVDSLDQVEPRRGQYYSLLEENWYTFYWIDG